MSCLLLLPVPAAFPLYKSLQNLLFAVNSMNSAIVLEKLFMLTNLYVNSFTFKNLPSIKHTLIESRDSDYVSRID
jgi:hypothetical protein